MKNLKIIAIALVSVFSFSSCSNDDPIAVNEGEVITTDNHFDCRKPDGNLDF
jgi:hypothetical protein